jgi:2,4-dienoyl-CoA reductase (NADPH2)
MANAPQPTSSAASHAAPSSGCSADSDHDRNVPEIDLLAPLTIRGLTLRNRIVMSPMCQYSCQDGFADDWHLVHLGSRAVGGAALIFCEATAVTDEGRISPEDLGLWKDQHIEPLARIARFVRRMGGVPAIQLAHAGRKASCQPPWQGGAAIGPEAGGWRTIAPSSIPFNEADPAPRALDRAGIEAVKQAFLTATRRALQAEFEIIEIHAAHGYLLHEFLSPLTNQRTDDYGGSLANRMRLLLEVTEGVRRLVPDAMPIFVRISGTDWVEGGWDIEQSVELARALAERGVDVIDVSSGGIVPRAKIPVGHNYQVPLSEQIRRETGIMTGAVGLITDAQQANEIITSGAADLAFIGRELLREPYWAIKTQQALGAEAAWPTQYGYAVKRRR